jgi:hypothetical protein
MALLADQFQASIIGKLVWAKVSMIVTLHGKASILITKFMEMAQTYLKAC